MHVGVVDGCPRQLSLSCWPVRWRGTSSRYGLCRWRTPVVSCTRRLLFLWLAFPFLRPPQPAPGRKPPVRLCSIFWLSMLFKKVQMTEVSRRKCTDSVYTGSSSHEAEGGSWEDQILEVRVLHDLRPLQYAKYKTVQCTEITKGSLHGQAHRQLQGSQASPTWSVMDKQVSTWVCSLAGLLQG